MSHLDGGFDPLHGRGIVLHPENYPPPRPQPDTGHEGWVQCVVGSHWVTGDDVAFDFGRDAWGQRFNQGYCQEHWPAPRAAKPASQEQG